MKVVLLRHATRSAQGLGDSPLNAVGQFQAAEIPQHLPPRGKLPKPSRLIASPKTRARQTLEPLSQATNVSLEIDPRLDERHQNETMKEFELRVRAILDDISRADSKSMSGRDETCIYVCSHLDWLELALAILPTNMSELEISLGWSTAEYRVFKIANGLWNIHGNGIITGRATP